MTKSRSRQSFIEPIFCDAPLNAQLASHCEKHICPFSCLCHKSGWLKPDELVVSPKPDGLLHYTHDQATQASLYFVNWWEWKGGSFRVCSATNGRSETARIGSSRMVFRRDRFG